MKKDEDKDGWPDFYPSDLVLPPKDATDLNPEEMVYRLVKTIPPTEMCFLATHQEQPNRHKKMHYVGGKTSCLWYQRVE